MTTMGNAGSFLQDYVGSWFVKREVGYVSRIAVCCNSAGREFAEALVGRGLAAVVSAPRQWA
jgi:hypothetical protein